MMIGFCESRIDSAQCLVDQNEAVEYCQRTKVVRIGLDPVAVCLHDEQGEDIARQTNYQDQRCADL